MIIFKLAWRNLWRNSKRSWISILAISTAFLILMVISGILDGMSAQMLKNGTELFQGHIQIHHQDYLPGRNMYDWIGYREQYDLESLLGSLDSMDGIQASAPRIYEFALISTGENTRATNLSGMDPMREPSVTRLLGSPIVGKNLTPDPRREILVGKVLANIMKLSPGDKVAIVTQAADGTTGNDLYTISGVISTGLTSLDRSLVVMHWRDLQELLAMEEWQVHEVALRVENPQESSRIAERVSGLADLPPDSEAESWEELLPQIKEYITATEGSGFILILLVGIFAGFGTLNTMMMAVFERTREIGSLSSLGMSPGQILSMFLLESFFLSILGLGIGFAGGLLILSYLTRYGLDLSAWIADMSFAGSHIDPVMQVVWSWDSYLISAVCLSIVVLLATIIPAIRAARMNPVDALAKI